MRLILLITFLLFFSTTYSQQINIELCNESNNLAARNECVKGYIESLLFDDLKPKADSLEISVTLKAEIYLDAIGNFYIKKAEGSLDNVKSEIDKTLKRIKPIGTYKNQEGTLLEDIISIEMNLKPNAQKLSNVNIPTEKNQTKEKDKIKADVPFATIEKVPVFPGCYQTTNEGLKKCMSEKVTFHVLKNFNQGIVNTLNLKAGIQRIAVQFKISSEGFVIDARARADHPALEEESIRVVNALPRMAPGMQDGSEVNVLYALPIIFQVEDDTQTKKEKKRKRKKG